MAMNYDRKIDVVHDPVPVIELTWQQALRQLIAHGGFTVKIPKTMKQANYRNARICKNCHWADLKFYGPSNKVGYYCTLYESRCCKTKVCDSHEFDGENYFEQ